MFKAGDKVTNRKFDEHLTVLGGPFSDADFGSVYVCHDHLGRVRTPMDTVLTADIPLPPKPRRLAVWIGQEISQKEFSGSNAHAEGSEYFTCCPYGGNEHTRHVIDLDAPALSQDELFEKHDIEVFYYKIMRTWTFYSPADPRVRSFPTHAAAHKAASDYAMKLDKGEPK